ncbi:hypothetical protein LXL04_036036 [Taraxacum kok-saghyz]
MEDSMLDMPDLVFDEKVSNKRVRDGEEDVVIGRLEKRPSGILSVNIGAEDCDKDGVNGGWEGGGGGIIETFISNVFHQNESVIEGVEVEVVEEKISEDLSIDSSGGYGGDGGGEGESGGGHGGGIINSFISNIFHQNGNGDGVGDQAKRDLLDEVHVEKVEDIGAAGDSGQDGGGGAGGGVESADLDAEKPPEKTNNVPDLSSKQLTGQKLQMRPDDYSERVFFLNNN